MNRQEVLHGLNNAVTLFKQQEALSLEYERVRQKDRPYGQKRKIGWIGIIVMGFEIYYFGGLLIGFLGGIVFNDTEIIEISAPFVMIGIAVIITTYLLFRMHNIKRNKKIDKENLKIRELNLMS